MRFRRSGLGIVSSAASFALRARAQDAERAPRHITVSEAVQLALKHNHLVAYRGTPSARETACEGGRPEWIFRA